MDVGLLAAFLGGTLALLSPCGALLLPAFFSSLVGAGERLWLHGVVFYAGLAVVLVPLGVGAGGVGALFVTHRDTVIVVASLVMIVLGVVMIVGGGFDMTRVFPGFRRFQAFTARRSGVVRSLLLGMSSGVAGFCAGPILGAVLTLAAVQDSVVASGALLAVYGAGMVIPLLALAVVWGQLGDRSRRVLRGRTVTVWGRQFHTTSLVTGLLIIVVGVVFWVTNGLVSMPALIPTSVQATLQQWVSGLSGPVVDIAVILVLAGVALTVWWVRQRSRR